MTFRQPLIYRWRQQKPRLTIHLAKIAHPPTAHGAPTKQPYPHYGLTPPKSDRLLERVTVPDIVVYGSDHVSGSAIQVVQPFTIYLAPLAQLEQADEKPLAKYPHADLELVFDLKLAKTKDGLELRLDFADLRGELGVPVPSDLQQRVKDAL